METIPTTLPTTTVTSTEAAIYDRQLRLWGVEAQKRIQISKILVCGISSLGAELVKNIVLAGMNVTLQDDEVVDSNQLGNLFLRPTDLGKNRAFAALPLVKELNPLAQVEYLDVSLENMSEKDISSFQVVCVFSLQKHILLRLDTLCRKNSIAFYYGHSFGYQGLFFANLHEHEFVRTPPVGENAPTSQTHLISFPSLEEVYSVNWQSLHATRRKGGPLSCVFIASRLLQEFQSTYHTLPQPSCENDLQRLQLLLHELLKNNEMDQSFFSDEDIKTIRNVARYQIPSVCAILGGLLGQEIVKFISKRDEPICNFFFYDGVDGSGKVKKIAKAK